MVISEEDLVPISALQHLMFCERQWAFIHLEGAWSENRFTAEGRILHEKVHGGDSETRKDLRVARGLSLRSLKWGLIGKADLVEFHRLSEGCSEEGARLPGRKGYWRPFPVEYKVTGRVAPRARAWIETRIRCPFHRGRRVFCHELSRRAQRSRHYCRKLSLVILTK
ncbi:MAG: Dna2/Cas4 domain-containing protein [Candidatus Riflebacteria bacterium]|nr:Dna2/Cas4 domain-containing protein [Candidatus Riflebacteria bacterium]